MFGKIYRYFQCYKSIIYSKTVIHSPWYRSKVMLNFAYNTCKVTSESKQRQAWLSRKNRCSSIVRRFCVITRNKSSTSLDMKSTRELIENLLLHLVLYVLPYKRYHIIKFIAYFHRCYRSQMTMLMWTNG